MSSTIQKAFDGEPPDRLVDDFDSQLDEVMTEFEPLIEKCRSIGMTVFVAVNAYDELTCLSFVKSKSCGNRYAMDGMLWSYLKSD